MSDPCEAIVIPVARARWWALALASPLPFLNWVAPVHEVPMPGPDDWCGNSKGWTDYWAAQALVSKPQQEHAVFIWLAIIGCAIALTSLIRAKTIVVIDRGARVLRVATPKIDRTLAFRDHPVLEEKDGGYWLRAGDVVVPIAKRSAPRRAIERLRLALERTLPETS